MATLQRSIFEISRAAEYFQPGELEKQTGQPQQNFAVVILKELVDNGIDAAEAAGMAPEIEITMKGILGGRWLSVTDNGGGLAPETLRRILNFSTRTSDKSAYRAPTRGAQGNAFKTVIGIPVALGSTDPVVVEACGVRHLIHSRFDPAGEPRIDHREEPGERRAGTVVTVCLPPEAGCVSMDRFDHWARAFSLFNPHALVRIRDLGEETYPAAKTRERQLALRPRGVTTSRLFVGSHRKRCYNNGKGGSMARRKGEFRR